MQGMGQGPTSEYEFTASENAVIEDLASKMRFVGMVGMLLGVLLGGAGIAGVVFNRMTAAANAGNIIQGVLMLFVGVWTRSAASGFRRIVDTQGHDIANLMAALGELRRIYTLQRVLFIAAV